jgi:hypothetical protein
MSSYRDSGISVKEYTEYINSREWDKRRAIIMMRARRTCEYCKQARAKQVHHLTYVRFTHELSTDLLAVCGECHSFIHNARLTLWWKIADGKQKLMGVKKKKKLKFTRRAELALGSYYNPNLEKKFRRR